MRLIVHGRCFLAAVVIGAMAGLSAAYAKPVRLDCMIADESATAQSPARRLVVVFDEERKTLSVGGDASSEAYRSVTISTVSINGAGANTTVGIDRSSWSIVFQTYRADGIETEMGACRPYG